MIVQFTPDAPYIKFEVNTGREWMLRALDSMEKEIQRARKELNNDSFSLPDITRFMRVVETLVEAHSRLARGIAIRDYLSANAEAAKERLRPRRNMRKRPKKTTKQ